MNGLVIALVVSAFAGTIIFWWRLSSRPVSPERAEAQLNHHSLDSALGMTEMFANMPDGILVTNTKGIIEYANPSFCLIFELSDERNVIFIINIINVIVIITVIILLSLS